MLKRAGLALFLSVFALTLSAVEPKPVLGQLVEREDGRLYDTFYYHMKLGPGSDTGSDTGAEGDDSNLNTGDTSGNQAASGAVGAGCTKDEDCTGTYSGSYGGEDYDQEAFCLTASRGRCARAGSSSMPATASTGLSIFRRHRTD